MAGIENVAGRLVMLQEAGESVRLAQGGEAVAPSREQFPGVGLVADVPEDLVGRRREVVEEGDGEFDDAQIGGEMASGTADGLDDPGADILGQHRIERRRERAHILWRIDFFQQRIHASTIRHSPPKGNFGIWDWGWIRSVYGL